MEKILNVAQYIFDAYKRVSGVVIDEMKMHKLLYLAQRETYAVLGKPLFKEDMEGWKYGPVSPEVRAYLTADGIAAKTEPVSAESAYIINNVIEEYGAYESWKLSEITHQESSWRRARKGLSDTDPGNTPLEKSAIQEDAKKVRPYDHVWDMYYDEFDDLQEAAP